MSRKCANCKKWLAAGQYVCPFCKRGESDLRDDLKKTNLAKLRAFFSGAEPPPTDEAVLVLLLAPYAKGEPLPEELCGETAAWGGSVKLLEAVVARGCARVGQHLFGANADESTRATDAGWRDAG